ncbi:hypothetical protein PG993_008445 [Apiospora rasikravindrae]|uniref:Heterokaryon incompatibility domain-containing protein n=1 Tax=Apiospora rasikravindrae TaxID=990691 RepID=A0ABR1T0D5_9PEZI
MTLPGPYGYEPLSKPNDIRLLDILPGRAGETPSISLRTANLSDEPDYEALSYVWGDVQKTEQILCNGHPVQVTTNLRDALRQLRFPDRPRTLWADALCINQSDLDERSQQVQIMHLIYKSCRRCVVWLGLADEHTDAALEVVQVMAELVCNKVNVPMEELDNHLKATGRDLLQAAEIGYSELLPPKDSRKWVSLFSLLSRPWFTRVWVIQEAFFSPDLLFHCGARTCRYAALYYTADWVLTNGQPITYALHFARADWDWYGTNRFNVMYLRPDEGSQQTQLLTDMLNNFAKFRATDPRDKVYALMHLPAFRREYPDLRPDYRRPTADVYVDVALRILQESRDPFLMLTMLDRGRSKDPDEEKKPLKLPSWVPPWHRSEVSLSISSGWYTLATASGASEKAQSAKVVRLVPPPELSYYSQAWRLLSTAFQYISTFGSSSPAEDAGAILGVRGFEFDVVHDVCELEFWGRRVPDEPRIPLFRPRTGPWAPYRPRKADSSSPDSEPLSSPSSIESPLDGRSSACPYPTEPDVVAAYALTLTGSCRAHRGIYPIRCAASNLGHHAADFVAFLTGLDDAYPARRHVPPGDFYPPGLYAAERPTLIDFDDQAVAEMSLRYSIMAYTYNMSRCLYRTRRGYLGTGPNAVQRGDIVCVFMGGAVPFILRPRQKGNGYTLIGDAYVHGIMDGELVRDWEEGKAELDLREFHIH